MHSVAPTSLETLPIGELSRRTGVNIETIRYYERIKMLPAPPRTSSGRRVYGPTEIRSLTFIRRSRELGFTLDEIRALLAISAADGNNTCGEVRQVAALTWPTFGQRLPISAQWHVCYRMLCSAATPAKCPAAR
jgi:MerR family mercuric resistance operon transcriptional regulator